MVAVKSMTVRVSEVFAISVTVPEKSEVNEDCHLRTLPTFPDNIKVVLLVPVHTVVSPEIIPPTDKGITVIAFTEENAEAHNSF